MMTEATLDDKIVLVTGSARRVGAAIVTRLHAAGASVVIHYRGSAKDAMALADRLNDIRADSAMTVQADLLESSAGPRLVSAILDWRGRLDVLVNNASTFYPTPLGEITEQDWNDLHCATARAVS
jgi:pteridine reductase